jgi:hypothetical protein
MAETDDAHVGMQTQEGGMASLDGGDWGLLIAVWCGLGRHGIVLGR